MRSTRARSQFRAYALSAVLLVLIRSGVVGAAPHAPAVASEGEADLGSPAPGEGDPPPTSTPDGKTPAGSPHSGDPAKADAAEPGKKRSTPADLRAVLDRARAYYESARYLECQDAYDDVLHGDEPIEDLDTDTVVEARLFYAACLIAVDENDDADEQMRAAVLLKPQLSSPDPLVFPTLVIERYLAIRSSLLDELRAREREKVQRARAERQAARQRQSAQEARLAQLEEIASRETLIVVRSRWMAAVPFGVGQFQNGDIALGWTFLLSEALLGGGALVAASTELGLHSAASESAAPLDKGSFDATLVNLRALMLWGSIGFAAVATLGIVEAEYAFVPESRIGERPRKLPPPPRASVAPVVAPTTGGAVFGLTGRF